MYSKSSKRTLLLMLYVASIIIGGFVPEVQAESILEGTPQKIADTTVYTAEVEPGQSFESVFGVRGDNTNNNHYGIVNIKEGTVTGTVYGSRVTSGDNYVKASYNKVYITDSNVGTVYGGYAYGGNNNAGVQNNEVNINGGNVTGYVYGGNSDGSTISITGNNVRISNAQIGRSVYGACAFNTESWLSMLRNNVIIENSNINGSVYGGYASGSATAANNNKITIKDNSNIKGSVCGGYALSNNSDAKNNTVIIEGGTLKNHIYGGIGKNTSGNTIVIKGGDLSAADLYGYSDGRKSHSANTLEIWTSEVKVRSAQNFENYYFLAPEDMINNDSKYMLRTDTPVHLSDSTVAVGIKNGTSLKVDDIINLIDNIDGIPTLTTLDDKELRGGTQLTVYDFRLECTEDNTLIAIANSSEEHERLLAGPLSPAGRAVKEARSLLGGQIASVALLNEALSDAKSTSNNKDGLGTFLSVNGGKSHYYTDSHVTINSLNLILGISKGLFGLYFESGFGDYSTFDSFDNGSESGAVLGNGKANYFGGGLMFQLESQEGKGLYFDAIGHIGKMYNEWNTDDINKEKISFDSNHLYFGSAVNTGYQVNIGKSLGFNVFGNFTWTHQNSNNADANGEQLHFKCIDSLKTGLGAKIIYSGIKNVKSFLEFAWEREFNGEARATVNGFKIDSPTLKGNTGLMKLGISCNPGTEANWQLDLTANGYIGVRKGLSGSVLFNVNF